MALRYVLDEDLRGVLWRAIQRHNRTDPKPIDAVRVGDLPDLPLGTPDPDILAWADVRTASWFPTTGKRWEAICRITCRLGITHPGSFSFDLAVLFRRFWVFSSKPHTEATR